MSNALLSAKVVITEAEPGVSNVTALDTAVAAIVGITERGPTAATLTNSFAEWVNIYGGYTLSSKETVAAVQGFYSEGGQTLWTVRTARYTDINDENSLEALAATGVIPTADHPAAGAIVLGNLTETFSLANADTLIVSLNGAAGVTSTFEAGPAEITAGNTETYDFEVKAVDTATVAELYVLTNLNTLTVSVDGEVDLVITFNTADFGNIALATAAEVVAVIATQHGTDLLGVDNGGTLEIENNRTVIGGRSLQITGGTDAAAFGFGGLLIQGQGAGDTVEISVDGEAALAFVLNAVDYADLNAATAAELATAVNGQFSDISGDVDASALQLSNARGIGTGFSIEVLGSGTADTAVLNFAGGAVSGTGDASDAAVVTGAELKTLFEADIATMVVTIVSGAVQLSTGATGPSETLQVLSSSTLDTKLGLSNLLATGTAAAVATTTITTSAKYVGEYGNEITIRIADSINTDTDRFDLLVLEDGVLKEQYTSLTMDDTAVDFIEDVINASPNVGGSQFISVVDADAALGSPTLDRPVNGDFSMTGGDNGLVNISDADFIGSAVALNGIQGLNAVNGVRLLMIPARPTAAVHNAMIAYAEIDRDGTLFCVLDPPAGLTAGEMVDYTENQALLIESSEYAAIYFPQVRIVNPNTTLFGAEDSITVPPSGHICGRYARTDTRSPGGVYKAPAGVNGTLRTIVGLEILANKEVAETFDEAKRDLLYPKRINPISEISGGRILDGSRTLKSTGNFPSIPERRGVIFIEVSIKAALETFKFRNNDDELRSQAARTVEAFLLDQMNVGAFRSRNPATAFTVDFGTGLNTDAAIFAGKLLGQVGLATNKPAEFIIVEFAQDTAALEQQLSQPA